MNKKEAMSIPPEPTKEQVIAEFIKISGIDTKATVRTKGEKINFLFEYGPD